MKLSDLAFTSYIYCGMTDYDSSYELFLDSSKPEINLKLDQHLYALLKWLNAWGCRQFSTEYHELAAKEIKEWYVEFNQRLISKDATILTLVEEDMKLIEHAFRSLASKTASNRNLQRGRQARIEIGPTGAAKILFSLRPSALIPWDDAMRKHFRLDGSSNSYCQYLGKVNKFVKEISLECNQNGFELSELPSRLGRPDSSITKLMDEYFWVTITRRCAVPNSEDLKTWLGWSY
jgi:hypothetical protein